MSSPDPGAPFQSHSFYSLPVVPRSPQSSCLFDLKSIGPETIRGPRPLLAAPPMMTCINIRLQFPSGPRYALLRLIVPHVHAAASGLGALLRVGYALKMARNPWRAGLSASFAAISARMLLVSMGPYSPHFRLGEIGGGTDFSWLVLRCTPCPTQDSR